LRARTDRRCGAGWIDRAGRTPLDHARGRGYEALVKLLEGR
jgi:hypothetical protein